jgi:hypothetical protein
VQYIKHVVHVFCGRELTGLKVLKIAFVMLMLAEYLVAQPLLVLPVNASGSVELLSNTGYLDSSGNYRVVGELRNIGSKPINYIRVTVTFYDYSNSVIDARFDLTILYVLMVGQKTPFEIALLDVAESASVDHYSINTAYQETEPLPAGLEILSNMSYKDGTGQMHVVGELKNIGTQKLANAKVVATFYDSNAHVVATALTQFDPELTGQIYPNQTASFDIVLDKQRSQYVQTYALAAQSNEYVLVPEFAGWPPILLVLAFLTLFVIIAHMLRLNSRSPLGRLVQ